MVCVRAEPGERAPSVRLHLRSREKVQVRVETRPDDVEEGGQKEKREEIQRMDGNLRQSANSWLSV